MDCNMDNETAEKAVIDNRKLYNHGLILYNSTQQMIGIYSMVINDGENGKGLQQRQTLKRQECIEKVGSDFFAI